MDYTNTDMLEGAKISIAKDGDTGTRENGNRWMFLEGYAIDQEGYVFIKEAKFSYEGRWDRWHFAVDEATTKAVALLNDISEEEAYSELMWQDMLLDAHRD
tara:strand:+ start:1787 stop:2089 length:303 start_codon:yes stop_codon:yes gene_type:complete